MLMERGRDHRRRSVPRRPYTYVGEHPAQNERFGVYGVSERKKCIADIPEMGEYEIRIPKPRVLV